MRSKLPKEVWALKMTNGCGLVPCGSEESGDPFVAYESRDAAEDGKEEHEKEHGFSPGDLEIVQLIGGYVMLTAGEFQSLVRKMRRKQCLYLRTRHGNDLIACNALQAAVDAALEEYAGIQGDLFDPQAKVAGRPEPAPPGQREE